ncbi:unnamed protein product, partial [Ectocarpus sp. 12 AP-2014]
TAAGKASGGGTARIARRTWRSGGRCGKTRPATGTETGTGSEATRRSVIARNSGTETPPTATGEGSVAR